MNLCWYGGNKLTLSFLTDMHKRRGRRRVIAAKTERDGCQQWARIQPCDDIAEVNNSRALLDRGHIQIHAVCSGTNVDTLKGLQRLSESAVWHAWLSDVQYSKVVVKLRQRSVAKAGACLIGEKTPYLRNRGIHSPLGNFPPYTCTTVTLVDGSYQWLGRRSLAGSLTLTCWRIIVDRRHLCA